MTSLCFIKNCREVGLRPTEATLLREKGSRKGKTVGFSLTICEHRQEACAFDCRAQQLLMLQADACVVLGANVAEVVRVRLESWVIFVIDVLGLLAAERTWLALQIRTPLKERLVRLHGIRCRACHRKSIYRVSFGVRLPPSASSLRAFPVCVARRCGALAVWLSWRPALSISLPSRVSELGPPSRAPSTTARTSRSTSRFGNPWVVLR